MKAVLKTVGTVVLNIITWLMIIFAAVFVILTLSSKQSEQGLPNLFGYSPLAVQSPSMDGDKPDSFAQGDMIFIKGVLDEEKTEFQKGDIIAFEGLVDGMMSVIIHRVVAVEKADGQIRYTTAGDANPGVDPGKVNPRDVLGTYAGKASGVGTVLDFLQSKWGFFVCLVLPMLLFFCWRLFKLVQVSLAISNENKLKAIEDAVAQARLEVERSEKENNNNDISPGRDNQTL